MLDLKELKAEVLQLKEDHDQCKIGYLGTIKAAIEINGKIERAIDTGQRIKTATVKTLTQDRNKKPVKCVWLENTEPTINARVEMVNIYDVLLAAFYKS